MRHRALALVLVSSTAFADGKAVWERTAAGKPPTPITMWCKNGNARMETNGEKKLVVIWDSEKKLLSILHPDEKVYEQLDPSRFAGLQGASAQGGGNETTYTATGKKQKVEKWDCELYKVKRLGMPLEMCLVPWAKSPVKKDELACMKSVADAFAMLGAKDNDGAAQDFTKMPGLPVQTTRDLGDGKANVMTLKGWEKGEPPAGAFTIPDDYSVRGRGAAK
jgi:hypothetical protein